MEAAEDLCRIKKETPTDPTIKQYPIKNIARIVSIQSHVLVRIIDQPKLDHINTT